MSILVTGGAGFIGSVVSRLLLESGETLVSLDNLNDSYDKTMKLMRLKDLRVHHDFQFHQIDISNYESLRDIFTSNTSGQTPFTSVIHLGARAGVLPSVLDPWTYVQTNVTGTLNLLELCREFKVNRLIFASTSSVYGSDTSTPFREDAVASRPLSPYAASKKSAEVLAHTYNTLHGIDIAILRFFTVYGPAGRPDMSIFMFIRAISEGHPIKLRGDGGERDFTYVDDVARGTIDAQKLSGYEIINLGGSNPAKIQRVIQILEDEIGQKAIIEPVARPPEDIQSTSADISQAELLLGWKPTVSLEEGLHRTVQWYKSNRNWVQDLSNPSSI